MLSHLNNKHHSHHKFCTRDAFMKWSHLFFMFYCNILGIYVLLCMYFFLNVSYVNGYKYDFLKNKIYGSWSLEYKHLTIPYTVCILPFHHFYSFWIITVKPTFPGSMFHASTLHLQVCQYLKLKTCLWSCKKEWFNLELEPKIDL